ncbi:MAG: hypothetical protein IID50_14375, partial [Proteobacteria bacterium]|nr:hypothetical protein [Pseudomonadota bacterium]
MHRKRISSLISAPTAVLIFGLLLPAPAVGQAADGGAAPAGTTAEVSLGDLEALVATIEDEAGRKRLVARIRALIAAQKSVTEEPAVESLGAGFIDRLSKPTFPRCHPNPWKSYYRSPAKGTVSLPQPSDGLILEIGPRPE